MLPSACQRASWMRLSLVIPVLWQQQEVVYWEGLRAGEVVVEVGLDERRLDGHEQAGRVRVTTYRLHLPALGEAAVEEAEEAAWWWAVIVCPIASQGPQLNKSCVDYCRALSTEYEYVLVDESTRPAAGSKLTSQACCF